MKRPKVLGYIILHYGRPYLKWALESLRYQVDDILVLYAKRPSQGHGTNLTCPDTREQLMDECNGFGVQWVDGEWGCQGDHCNAVFQFSKGYDFLWRFDADEITPPGMVEHMIRQTGSEAVYQVPFMHFWRSFHRVCRDGQCPVRLVKTDGDFKGPQRILDGHGKYIMHHFGYAQPTLYIEYKWTVIDHKPELKPKWFNWTWIGNAQTDVHPVCNGMWNTEPFDKRLMPEVLKNHPFYNLEII